MIKQIKSLRCALFLSLLLVLPSSANAATRTPVQSCAIIHAVFVAKNAAADFAAAKQYCRRYLPSKPATNNKLHANLSRSTAKRRSVLGVTANKQVARLGGESVCDPDIQDDFPKPDASALPALVTEVETLLNDALVLCNERN